MKNFSFLKDPKAINVLEITEKKLINLLDNKLQDIILYGSYARNDYTNESDIDILVLANDEQQNLKLYEDMVTDTMVDISLEYDVVLSIYLQSVQEYKRKLEILPFLQNIEREGVKIYAKENS
ncbi:nucleotidyltransferase domain-containing protein [Clostridium sp. P21]|uniref:Nucleotidyltransferase domain-containing protein n=1 Tax=Clostridium muellerianum TaxID=2716538 RepID=A0A7Y0HQU3_9CLOT|nr:nucleotidyltransferase domain-containing protein [Clostridium muellerianum]